MPTKLFGVGWTRQTRQARELLDDSNIIYQYIEVEASIHATSILDTVVGSYQTPILFVNGIAHRGVEGVRDYVTG